MIKKKKRGIRQIIGLIIGLSLIIFVGIKLAETLSLELVRDVMPKGVLSKDGGAAVYEKQELNTEQIDYESFSPYLLYATGQGVGEYRSDVYASCNSDAVRDITFFCGDDAGDIKDNIAQYSDMFYLAFGRRTISYASILKEEGSFDGYSAIYDAGRLRINKDSKHDLYVLSYRIYLNRDMGNKWFVCFTSKKDAIADAKLLLDYMTKQLLDASKIVEEETDSVFPGEVSQVSANDIGNTRVTDKQILENGDKVWQQGDITVRETVNFDYLLTLETPYKLLHVSYEYVDITQVPDSIILISPENKIYQPSEVEQMTGTVTFLVEDAQPGKWTLSVRNSSSLGGAQILFMEEEKWRDLHGYDTGRFD